MLLFIFIITINSGLMYRVQIPSYSHLEVFAAWYWAIPYIIAIFAIKTFFTGFRPESLIYFAIFIMGISFVAFYFLEKSLFGFFVVNTLMLGAFGIIDIYWWSTLGEIIQFYNNPAKIFGAGLAANVSGVVAGGIIGELVYANGTISDFKTMIIAISVIAVTLFFVPGDSKRLTVKN